ncbi:hypothetical protein [Nocardioides insulae]|uniref:hypothetical protein n=1 Tax=Nocardioides insulae TaxID=394734 RepID=UPI0003F6CB43|nr:hypothetical protein [Nocardioides insulae]
MEADAALVAHVVARTGLSGQEAARVIEDVLAYHAEPVDDFVRRRHAALQLRGARNDEIFARLEDEVSGRVVAAPRLTRRQLRRMVYG